MSKFKNLEAEMVRCSLKNEDIANELIITPQTVRRKLNGEVGITIEEAKRIQKLLLERNPQANYTIDFLFAEQLMSIDVSKISETDGRIIARQFLKILERDFENPAIRADFEKWRAERDRQKIRNNKGTKNEEKNDKQKRRKEFVSSVV